MYCECVQFLHVCSMLEGLKNFTSSLPVCTELGSISACTELLIREIRVCNTHFCKGTNDELQELSAKISALAGDKLHHWDVRLVFTSHSNPMGLKTGL